MITSEQVRSYRDDGYILVPDLLEAGLVAAARAELDRLLDGARGLTGHDDRYDLEPSHRPDDPRVRRIKSPHTLPVFDAICRHPSLLSVLEKLIGPSLRLHGSKINLKAPRLGSPIEWHQDWAAYPHTNEDVLAIGVMLDDCELKNGPLLVIPGSHRDKIYSHHSDGRFCGAIDPSELDLGKAIPLTGSAGSITFHHVRLVHGSALNESTKRRAMLFGEYAATDAWPLLGVADYDEFNSRIVQGEPTNLPRMTSVEVRMPFPRAPQQGSVYEMQRSARSRYFKQFEEHATG